MACCTLGCWAGNPAVPIPVVSTGHASSAHYPEDVGSGERGSQNDCHAHNEANRWKWRLVLAYDGTKYSGCYRSPIGRAEDEEEASDFEPGHENGEEEDDDDFEDEEDAEHEPKQLTLSKRKRKQDEDTDDSNDDERPSKH